MTDHDDTHRPPRASAPSCGAPSRIALIDEDPIVAAARRAKLQGGKAPAAPASTGGKTATTPDASRARTAVGRWRRPP